MISAILILLATTIFASDPRVEFRAQSPNNVNGLALANPQGLAVNDRTAEFLVADALNDRVIIFDTNGVADFVFTLSEGQHNPFGIAVNSQDEIFISPMDAPSIWVYDYGGRYLNSIELPPDIMPGRMIFDKSDNLYVVNRAGRDIIQLDSRGEIVKRFASPDSACKPSGVCFDGAGHLLLVSFGDMAVTAFNQDGTVAYRLGKHGRMLEDFSHPTSAAVDLESRLWVIDSFRHHIKRFDANRKFIDIFGERGTHEGELYFPVDVKMTSGNKLGILDKGSGRLQIFGIVYDQ